MNNKLLTGKNGEDFAQVFLIRNGYKIIERNHWKPWGELDIIALAPDKTLVFVEVKTINLSTNNSKYTKEAFLFLFGLKSKLYLCFSCCLPRNASYITLSPAIFNPKFCSQDWITSSMELILSLV